MKLNFKNKKGFKKFVFILITIIIMSYQSLYRKYRPFNLDQVVGQEQIIQSFKNIIEENKISHAYLFSGPRGVGKTSLARIFSREINQTKEINNLDIIEIDAASNNGVDEIRQLINDIAFVPTNSKYKVYIIDEVHMLTKGAWNALLKILEEPPKYVVFILATTESYKIPLTVISRVQRFNFKKINFKDISNQLELVLKQEKIEFEKNALDFLAKIANGSMRDAFSLLEQAISFGDITLEKTLKVFNMISIEKQIDIINQTFKGDYKELVNNLNYLLDSGIDIEKLIHSLLDILREFIIFNKTQDLNLISNLNVDNLDLLKNLSLDFAYQAIEKFMSLLSEIKWSEIPFNLFEVTLFKLMDSNSIKQEVSVEKKPILIHREIKQEIIKPKPIVKEVVQKEAEEKPVFNQKKKPKHFDDYSLVNPLLHEINFEIEEEKKAVEEKPLISHEDLSIDQYLNFLILSKKDAIEEIKQKWNMFNLYIDDQKFSKIALLLLHTKIISVGDNFIFLSSEENDIIESLDSLRNNQDLLSLINKVLNKPMWVYVINKMKFDVLKKTWYELSQTNKLPKAKIIESPTIQEEQKDAIEQFGQDIFGDLLKVEK